MLFKDRLKQYNIDPKTYIDIARKRAYNKVYDPMLLTFSTDKKKKLNYGGVDFGASGYNDYIIYSLIDPANAEKKRINYCKRAKQTALETNDKYSPAMLSLEILW